MAYEPHRNRIVYVEQDLEQLVFVWYDQTLHELTNRSTLALNSSLPSNCGTPQALAFSDDFSRVLLSCGRYILQLSGGNNPNCAAEGYVPISEERQRTLEKR